MTSRKIYSSKFKGKIALEALKGEKTFSEISSFHKVSPARIGIWRKQLIEGVESIYKNDKGDQNQSIDYENKQNDLHRKIGELSIENDYLKKKLN
jgi:transposase